MFATTKVRFTLVVLLLLFAILLAGIITTTTVFTAAQQQSPSSPQTTPVIYDLSDYTNPYSDFIFPNDLMAFQNIPDPTLTRNSNIVLKNLKIKNCFVRNLKNAISLRITESYIFILHHQNNTVDHSFLRIDHNRLGRFWPSKENCSPSDPSKELSPSTCDTGNWINASVVQIDHNVFPDQNQDPFFSNFSSDNLYVVWLSYNISSYDKSELIVTQNEFYDYDWNTIENRTATERLVQSWIYFPLAPQFCSNCLPHSIHILGAKNIEISYNKIYDRILMENGIVFDFLLLQNVRRLAIEHNSLHSEYASSGLGGAIFNMYQIDNTKLPSSSSSSSSSVISISYNIVEINHLNAEKWEQRRQASRHEFRSPPSGCSGIVIRAIDPKYSSGVVSRDAIFFIRNLDNLWLNNNTFKINHHDDPLDMGDSRSCSSLEMMRLRLSYNTENSTQRVTNDSAIENLKVLSVSANTISFGGIATPASTRSSTRVLETSIHFPIRHNELINISHNNIFLREGRLRVYGIRMGFLGLFDFDRFLVVNNSVLLGEIERTAQGIHMSGSSDFHYLSDPALHEWTQGWRRGKVIEVSNNRVKVEMCRRDIHSLQTDFVMVRDIDSIRVVNNDINSVCRLRELYLSANDPLTNRFHGIVSVSYFDRIGEVIWENNICVLDLAFAEEVRDKMMDIIDSSSSKLLQNVVLSFTFSGYARTVDQLAEQPPDFNISKDVVLFRVRGNRFQTTGITNEFFATRTSCVSFAFAAAVSNFSLIDVSDNFCQISRIFITPPFGCNLVDYNCGSNCTSMGRLNLVNNSGSFSGFFLSDSTTKKASNVVHLLQVGTMSFNVNDYFPPRPRMVVDGRRYSAEFDSIIMSSNSLYVGQQEAKTAGGRSPGRVSVDVLQGVIGGQATVNRIEIVGTQVRGLISSSSSSSSSSLLQVRLFHVESFNVLVIPVKLTFFEYRALTSLANFSIFESILLSSNIVDGDHFLLDVISSLQPVIASDSKYQQFYFNFFGTSIDDPKTTSSELLSATAVCSDKKFNSHSQTRRGFFVDNFTFHGYASEDSWRVFSFASANTSSSKMDRMPVCLRNVDIDLKIPPRSSANSDSASMNFVFFETFQKLVPGIVEALAATETTLPSTIQLLRSKVKIDCSSGNTNNNNNNNNECSFSETTMPSSETNKVMISASLSSQHRLLLFDSSSVEFLNAAPTGIPSIVSFSQLVARRSSFSVSSSVVSSSLFAIISSNEINNNNNNKNQQQQNQIINISDCSINITSVANNQKLHNFSLISIVTNNDERTSYKINFRNINTHWNTNRDAIHDLRMVNAANVQNMINIESQCIFLNNTQLCESSPPFLPFNNNNNSINNNENNDNNIIFSHQLCSLGDDCGFTAERTKTRELDDDDKDDNDDSSSFQFEGKLATGTSQGIAASTSVFSIASGISGSPSTAIIAARGLSISSIMGCPKRNPNGEKWTHAQLEYPNTLFPKSFGIGSLEHGYYLRGAIVGFLVWFVVVPIIGAVGGYLVWQAKSKTAIDNASSNLPPKSDFVKVMSMKGFLLVLGVVTVQLSEQAAMLTEFREGAVDGILVFVPLLGVAASTCVLGYFLSKAILHPDHQKQQEMKKNSSRKEKQQQDKNTQPSQAIEKKILFAPAELCFDGATSPSASSGVKLHHLYQEDTEGGRNTSGLKGTVKRFMFSPLAQILLFETYCWTTKVIRVPGAEENNNNNNKKPLAAALSPFYSCVHRIFGPLQSSSSTTTIMTSSDVLHSPGSSSTSIPQSSDGDENRKRKHQGDNNNNNNTNRNDNRSLRDKFRGRILPYYFIIVTIMGCIVGFLNGLAKLHPDNCRTMLSLIAVFNSLYAAFSIFLLFPIDVNKFRAYLTAFIDVSTALLSIIIASSLYSPETIASMPGLVSFVDVFVNVGMLVPSISISVSLGLSVFLMTWTGAVLKPISSSEKRTKLTDRAKGKQQRRSGEENFELEEELLNLDESSLASPTAAAATKSSREQRRRRGSSDRDNISCGNHHHDSHHSSRPKTPRSSDERFDQHRHHDRHDRYERGDNQRRDSSSSSNHHRDHHHDHHDRRHSDTPRSSRDRHNHHDHHRRSSAHDRHSDDRPTTKPSPVLSSSSHYSTSDRRKSSSFSDPNMMMTASFNSRAQLSSSSTTSFPRFNSSLTPSPAIRPQQQPSTPKHHDGRRSNERRSDNHHHGHNPQNRNDEPPPLLLPPQQNNSKTKSGSREREEDRPRRYETEDRHHKNHHHNRDRDRHRKNNNHNDNSEDEIDCYLRDNSSSSKQKHKQELINSNHGRRPNPTSQNQKRPLI